MRLVFRVFIPVIIVIGILLFASFRFVDSLQERWLMQDFKGRTKYISDIVSERIFESKSHSRKFVDSLDKLYKSEHLAGLILCDQAGGLAFKAGALPPALNCERASTIPDNPILKETLDSYKQLLGVSSFRDSKGQTFKLVILYNTNVVKLRQRDSRFYVLGAFVIFTLILLFTGGLVARMSWAGWMEGARSLVRGFRGVIDPPRKYLGSYHPIVRDLRKLVRDLESRRTARDETNLTWTPRLLKDILHDELQGEQVIIVANREPFIHNMTHKGIEVQRPASGLVTALEPIMEACSGVWIAHGNGSADRMVVDRHDKVQVPPEKPTYAIRRIWLTEEEEKGYYYGFANEGLWPLCHIAHTRPLFRTEDFEHYKLVNEKFAEAVVEEAKSDQPVILIQDYHFALLPKMIRQKLPKAVIITFWHIPWPNPEVFGICPWREELLEGLLGSSIVGFHTQFHCNNFFETVDRYLESRIDREESAISYMGELTGVKPYPISIEWPPKWLKDQEPIFQTRKKVRDELGLSFEHKLGVGIDRLDYTKGIVERLQSVDKLFKLHPQWIGKFTFLQIAAPSRSSIPSYRALQEQVKALAEEINKKYGTAHYKPVILKIQHFEPPEVYRYFRATDFCYVSSLHDGMNLVSKEFVASREDEQGVLILSSFTGASRELPEALIVNPYNIDQAAESLHLAMKMSPVEQKERMRSMRGLIREYNVYRWAGRMLLDAANIKKKNRFMRRIGSSLISSRSQRYIGGNSQSLL